MVPIFVGDVVKCRTLVIGSGIAGLQFALLAAQDGEVCIVTKKKSQDSNTNYAQGGIAAAVSPLDDFEIHVQDTLVAGDGLCDEGVVREMVAQGPALINRLLDYGVQFTPSESDDEGAYALGREGGHSRRRILHCKDLTGKEIELRLLEGCHANKHINLEEDHMGLDLIHGHEVGLEGDLAQRIVGCVVLDRKTLERQSYLADNVVLATGGCGKVYSYTSNPDIATGDGLAMAYRAGAQLMNLEFVQFHPTCLYHPDARSFLISEAVRGEGAVLTNHRGERFMERYHPMSDLAPRDIVARSIDQEMKNSGDPCAFLDLEDIPRGKVEDRFPHLVATCAKFGLDMAGEPIPVVPAAHYMCGGIAVDLDGKSSLEGLYVIGESACSGVHGANRLASNSLLEAVFFAERTANAIRSCKSVLPDKSELALSHSLFVGETGSGAQVMVLEHDWDLVRRIMWDYVGIVRDEERLEIARNRLRSIRKTVEIEFKKSLIAPEILELRNIALLGELIVLCALDRKESRGLHYSLNYPGKLSQIANTVIRRGETTGGLSSWEPAGTPSV
jgi:L-aspartate oxidase